MYRPSTKHHNRVQIHESPPQLTEPQRANAKTCLQDRPNLRHKLAEVLYILTLFQ